MKILKETKSVSPVTKKLIPAKIIQDDGKIYLIKEDEQGATYKGLLEKEPALYNNMTSDRVTNNIPFQNIQLFISSRCNLDCPICYEAYSDSPEPSLEEIDSFLSKQKKKFIVLCGLEPTMRSDLLEIIKLVNKNNFSVLLTNGLKLADYKYVISLKKAGLGCITLSFNGFDDKVYEAMNGAPLLDKKLKALENIKKVGLRTCISVTLGKGINEDQLKSIYDYCIKNSDFIHEVRIRTVSDVGKTPGTDQIYLSEMLDSICRATNISKEAVLKEHALVSAMARTFRLYYLLPKLCTFRFHVLINKGAVQPIGKNIKYIPSGTSLFRYVSLPYYMLKYYGSSLIKKVLCLVGLTKSEGYPRLLCVKLKCWPNIYNVDFDEIMKCSGGYFKNQTCSSFCLTNILSANNRNKS